MIAYLRSTTTQRKQTKRKNVKRVTRTIAIGQVLIGRRDGQYNGIGIVNVFTAHFVNLGFNVARLIADGDLGNAGQIHDRQCQDAR